jgi:DNA polymerase III subunit gamma/tau
MEMDAASRTGVGDIREIIDSSTTGPPGALQGLHHRRSAHAVDGAFNALLKTLEEPPAHVKFIFATTEIRKVPVTVLSRCQRFDLKRIEPEVMMAHLRRIAGRRGAAQRRRAGADHARRRRVGPRCDEPAGSGDQPWRGRDDAEQVRAMLGLADRGRTLDLFDLIMKGDAAGALAELSAQYADGADPMAVLRDLAEITHWISVIKINPAAAEDPTTPPDEQTRGQDMAAACRCGR